MQKKEIDLEGFLTIGLLIYIVLTFCCGLITSEAIRYFVLFYFLLLLLLSYFRNGEKNLKAVVIFTWAGICFVVITIIASQIKEKHDIRLFAAEREFFAENYEKEAKEYLANEKYVYEAVVRNDFQTIENETDSLTKKYIYYYNDTVNVTLYLDASFEALSDKEKIAYANKHITYLKKMLNDCCKTDAPFYYDNISKGNIPGNEIRGTQNLYVNYVIQCNGHTYERFGEESFWGPGGRTDPYKVDKPKQVNPDNSTKPGSNANNGGKSDNSKNKEIFHDPDDYDDPDDYADDAWGVDFDSWDDAYDYWEDW